VPLLTRSKVDDEDGSDEPKPKKKAAPRRKKKVHALNGVPNNDLPYRDLSRLIPTRMLKSQALTMRVAQTTAQARNVSVEESRRAPGKGLRTMTINVLVASRHECLAAYAALMHIAGSIFFTVRLWSLFLVHADSVEPSQFHRHSCFSFHLPLISRVAVTTIIFKHEKKVHFAENRVSINTHS
jgi:hypothetical protein